MEIPEQFQAQSALNDFCLVVEDRKLWVNKGALAVVSPVLEQMVLGDFKEAATNSAKLPGKELAEVLSFLRWVYHLPAEEGKTYTKVEGVARIAAEDIPALILLAEEWQIDNLQADCGAVWTAIVSDIGDKQGVLSVLQYCRLPGFSAEARKQLLRKLLRYDVALADLETISIPYDLLILLQKKFAKVCQVCKEGSRTGEFCSCLPNAWQ